MAYVRKTQELVDGIRDQVRTMSKAAREPYSDSDPAAGTPEYEILREAAIDASFADAPHLKGKLPEAWLGRPHRVRGYISKDGQRVASFDLRSTEANPIYLSPSDRSSWADVHMKYENLSERAQAWVDGAAARKATYESIKEKFNVVEKQLRDYMSAHSSLNTALKELPDLEMYVPDRFMRKYRAAAEPRAKAPKPTNVQDLNIDVDALAAAAITHRITQRSA